MTIDVLGISAYYHDSAAALIRNGRIIAAAEEERFTRVKHDRAFPQNAAAYCLKEAGIGPENLAAVAYYDKPLLAFERLLETYLAFAPAGLGSFCRAVPAWTKEKIFLSRTIDNALHGKFSGKMLFFPHHLSHAASAFYPSPFERAAILTADGVGEWSTATIGIGDKNTVRLIEEIRFPHSLGLLYSAFTYYLGFRVNSGEYKVMGLAPYGQPRYYDAIASNLIHIKKDGSFWMNMRYFNYCQGLTMTSRMFETLFEGQPRRPESELTQRHMDLAASVQKVVNEVMIKMARHARALTGEENLCLAGGVALNCTANGILSREKIFKRIFAQPAAGDAGGALGAAFLAVNSYFDHPRTVQTPDSMHGGFVGPAFSRENALGVLKNRRLIHIELSEDALIKTLCDLLDSGMIVGLFRGRMEFGPRALGARSILADPRKHDMRKRLNLMIKLRESFRPFAPSVPEEDAADYFDGKGDPYMMTTVLVKEARRQNLPAVTHVDGSARVQIVSAKTNPFFHRLLRAYQAKTGCPVLINTSFNVRGEPIVMDPDNAVDCFMNSGLDALAIDNFLLLKSEQAPREAARKCVFPAD
ncbi:MAG: carbamoyltransferase family protein [Elusimicrobiota bacterium]